MVKRKALVASALLALLAGCSRTVTENPTALFVVAEADPGVRGRSAVVRVTTRRRVVGPNPMVLDTEDFRPGPNGWPFTFVVQAQNPDTAVEIYAEVLDTGNVPVSTARAITAYVTRQTRVVPLMFWGGCSPDRCDPLQTCQRTLAAGPVGVGDCASAAVAPTSLAQHSASASYSSCGMMHYRYGADCRMFLASPAGDGGITDAATVDVPSDIPIDVPIDIPMDVPGDAAVADATMDVGATDVPADRGIDVGDLVDVPLCPLTPVQCDGGGMIGTLLTDTNNCGACGYACPVRAHTAVECVRCACDHHCTAGYRDCDGVAANGCETQVSDDPANCGACSNRCVAQTDGGAPACLDGVCLR